MDTTPEKIKKVDHRTLPRKNTKGVSAIIKASVSHQLRGEIRAIALREGNLAGKKISESEMIGRLLREAISRQQQKSTP